MAAVARVAQPNFIRGPVLRAQLSDDATGNMASPPVIRGFTRDVNNVPLAGVTVRLFDTATNVLVQDTISDSTGYYSFTVGPSRLHYAVAYLALNPFDNSVSNDMGPADLSGTTISTLAAV